MKNSIGIMQGRLTKPLGRGIQFFPFDNWENEFRIAQQLRLDEIEFIFDYENYESNPLWKDEEQKLENIIRETGVKVNSVCFDYFMRRPFYKYEGDIKEAVKEENQRILLHVLESMKRLGIRLLEIPLVDNSSLKSKKEEEEFKNFLLDIIDTIGGNHHFGLETDLPPRKFRSYIESFKNESVFANYDSGNSSGLGYDPYEEITVLSDLIYNIHIKDRIYQGTTVKLGTGSAQFPRLFRALEEINYSGSFILQAARAEEGLEKDNISEQIIFVEENINTYMKRTQGGI